MWLNVWENILCGGYMYMLVKDIIVSVKLRSEEVKIIC